MVFPAHIFSVQLAAGIISTVRSLSKGLVVDLGWVMQGEESQELPEMVRLTINELLVSYFLLTTDCSCCVGLVSTMLICKLPLRSK